jgi:Tfp pilus assembly protein PilO
LGGVIVAIFTAFYLVEYRPVTSHLRDVRQEIAAGRRVLSANLSRTQTLPIIHAEVQSLRRRLEHFDRKLPRSQDLGPFLEDVARLRENNALRSFSLVRSDPQRSDLFWQIPVKMEFEGDFMSAFSFLRQTEEMQRITRLRSMSIKAKDSTQGTVQVKVEKSIYYSEG